MPVLVTASAPVLPLVIRPAKEVSIPLPPIVATTLVVPPLASVPAVPLRAPRAMLLPLRR